MWGRPLPRGHRVAQKSAKHVGAVLVAAPEQPQGLTLRRVPTGGLVLQRRSRACGIANMTESRSNRDTFRRLCLQLTLAKWRRKLAQTGVAMVSFSRHVTA
jgi:hypothetical protein